MDCLPIQNSFSKPHKTTFLFTNSTSETTFLSSANQTELSENNNQQSSYDQQKTVQEIWTQQNFNMNKNNTESSFEKVKMTWADKQTLKKVCEPNKDPPAIVEVEYETVEEKDESPSHHARRPPNAFLIFCKKHRPIVRERFPNLENRGVTKILGEWWALLNCNEKQPYNDLAKEYKDAFLSANPNFRWYKLPAPPLRTLTTRPILVSRMGPPSTIPSEFTPGKLADETQLGGLTSLMNNNFSATQKSEQISAAANDAKEKFDVAASPISNIVVTTPPKPLKKRFPNFYSDSKGCARNILFEDDENEKKKSEASNLTKQDLVDKVVDGIFAKHETETLDNSLKEVRKSERMCKGKRYEVFMVEGKLLGNKREAKWINQRHSRIENKIENELNMANNNNVIKKPETPKLDLGETIKRLAERTNIKIDFNNDVESNDTKFNVHVNRVRSISETSEGGTKSSPPNFNLELRISDLPSLRYDEFLQRKRDSKKRKIRPKTDEDIKHKIQKLDHSDQLVGSKKRKNKQSITHLGKKDEANLNNELIGLATLAEVAANTEKINEKISE